MIVGLFNPSASLGQVRAEKKEKKHFEKQKKAMGMGSSMIQPKEPAKPVRTNFQLVSFDIFCAGYVIGLTSRCKSAICRGQRIG